MRELVVLKSGFDTFDVLHALGLGVVTADVMGIPVRAQDVGTAFHLTLTERPGKRPRRYTLHDILVFPHADAFRSASKFELANLDGCLAASYTMLGPRLVSVADMKTKAYTRPEVVNEGLSKAASLTTKICRIAPRMREPITEWIEALFKDYREDCPTVPQFRDKTKRHLSLTMPLDPGFGFSSRRPFSDAMLVEKQSMTMQLPRHGVALAYIGAARYLRAQRAKYSTVLMFVPAIKDLLIQPKAYAARLPATSIPAQRAVHAQWLSSWQLYRESASGIMVQILQTQGSKQSRSVERTVLDYAPLNHLADRGCAGIFHRWQSTLTGTREDAMVDVDLLVDLLSSFGDSEIQRYLIESAQRNFRQSCPSYVHDIQEIAAMVEYQITDSALAQVIDRPHGTVRFGQAIRLLAEQNRSVAREIVDDLDLVQTQDQLLRVLARAIQQCVLAKMKSNFILVPDENDLAVLLEDIHHHGVKDVAGLLIILSVVYYPKVADSSQTAESMTLEPSLIANDSKE